MRHPLSSPGKLEAGAPLRVPSRGCLGSFNHPLVSDTRSRADGATDVTAASLGELRAVGGPLASALREGEPLQFVKVDAAGLKRLTSHLSSLTSVFLTSHFSPLPFYFLLPPFSHLKVDVEGAEIDVIRAHLLPLLRRRLIRHLVVEVCTRAFSRLR